MQLGKARAHLLCRADLDLQSRIASRRTQPRAAEELDALRMHALLDQRFARAPLQLRQGIGKIVAERPQHAGVADRLHVRDADAIS